MIQTIDILITINNKKVLLIKRAKMPFMDKLVLPGGHVEKSDESLAHACAREALEETGFKTNPDSLNQLITLDSPNRDPRPGRRISTVFHIDLPNKKSIENCKAASDAKSLHLVSLDLITEEMIGFDHFKAIQKVKKHSH